MIRFAAMLFALLLPLAAMGEDYPSYDNIWVNDQAGVLSEAAEERITAELQTLADETGVQATVLTMHTRWGYPGTSLEDFATGLFNDWGIGNAETNDGILVLVLTTDRQMRIELGAGYPKSFDAVAQEIIDDHFIPAFGKEDYEGGIEAGTAAVLTRIARAHAEGNEPEPEPAGESDSESDSLGLVIVGAIMAAFVAAGVFGGRIADRFRHCPSCGARGVHTKKTVLTRPTRNRSGSGEKTIICPHCGHRETVPYVIARKDSSSSSGSFGGGSSSGGGASGNW